MNKLFRGSLKQKLAELIVFAACVSVLLYFGLNHVVTGILDEHFEMSTYIDSQYDRCAEDLQNFVTASGAYMDESGLLSSWVSSHKDVQLIVYGENGELEYSSGSSESAGGASADLSQYDFDRVRYYEIAFADGVADVYMFGSFDYKVYVYAMAAETALCVLVFFLLVMLGMRDRINYIRVLENDVASMEGGELEQPVTVRGKDELGSLASKLDEMRCSFADRVRAEEEATKANRELVTEMSHDLRTPLTSLLLYTEILRSGKYSGEAEMRACLDKISGRAMQIKQLSDAMFYHFLVDKDVEEDCSEENVRTVFGDLASDFICTLEARGFRSETTGEPPEGSALICQSYLMRIMDNLLTNIFKYADESRPVSLAFGEKDGSFVFSVANRVRPGAAGGSGSGVGIDNVSSMMRRMGGSFTPRTENGVFTAVLVFPLCGKKQPGSGNP